MPYQEGYGGSQRTGFRLGRPYIRVVPFDSPFRIRLAGLLGQGRVRLKPLPPISEGPGDSCSLKRQSGKPVCRSARSVFGRCSEDFLACLGTAGSLVIRSLTSYSTEACELSYRLRLPRLGTLGRSKVASQAAPRTQAWLESEAPSP